MGKSKVTIHKDDRPGRANKWLVRWFGDYDPALSKQRRYCKSFRTRNQAEQFQTEKQSELNDGDPRDPQEITLKELCDQYIKSKKHQNRHATTNGYKYTIDQLLQFFPSSAKITTITKQQAEKFINTRELVHPDHMKSGKELSAWGRNSHLKHAAAIFNAAMEWDYIKKNPFGKIKPVKTVNAEWHYFTPDEFQAILTHTPTLRLKCFYGSLYGCGLRYGEAINLFITGNRDIDLKNVRINIKHRKATKEIPPFSVKDHESRSLPIPSWLVHMLTKLQQEKDDNSPFIFLTEQRWKLVQKKWDNMRKTGKSDEWENRHMANNMLRHFQGYCEKAGIKMDEKTTLHGLRKSYAQNLADHGTPISTLKKLMGHSSVRVTEQYYLKSTDANEERACRILDNMFDKKNNIDTNSMVNRDEGESSK